MLLRAATCPSWLQQPLRRGRVPQFQNGVRSKTLSTTGIERSPDLITKCRKAAARRVDPASGSRASTLAEAMNEAALRLHRLVPHVSPLCRIRRQGGGAALFANIRPVVRRCLKEARANTAFDWYAGENKQLLAEHLLRRGLGFRRTSKTKSRAMLGSLIRVCRTKKFSDPFPTLCRGTARRGRNLVVDSF